MTIRPTVLCLALLVGLAIPAWAGPGNAPRPGPPAPASEKELYMGGFDGTWTGKMRVIDPAAYDAQVGSGKPGSDWEFGIVVAGTAVKVFYRHDGKWSEVKPGAFHIAQHKTTATIYAIDSASDVYDTTGSGGWVESWTYALTHKDADTLHGAFWRTVNNYLEKPGEKKNARFFVAAFGDLKKVAALPQ